MYPIFTRYLYNICPILYWPISIWYLYDTYMICTRYYTTRYMCNMCTIFIIYITEFLHKRYRYLVPDMCVIAAYRVHIIYISYAYRVPDRYPIASILTCVSALTNPFFTLSLSLFLSLNPFFLNLN
jgi:hypothetical protein